MNKGLLCDKKLSFEDCELTILRMAVDKAQERVGSETVKSPEIVKMITILENFLRRKRLICYGGTALNNIMPKQDKFYNKDIEIPDYDFFSTNALQDTKELCDIYIKEGFVEVEGKPGMHHGTFKVFVNFIPIADITFLQKDIFNAVKKESISVAGISYAAPNFLRMSMFLELSRPEGDNSRFEKVLKRLNLLNKNYPITSKNCGEVDFQRDMEDKTNENEIFENIKNTLVDQGVVFFGGYALSLYSNYMPKPLQKQFKKYPDFDVLSEEPLIVAQIIKERLGDIGVKHVKVVKKNAIGEIIAPHYEIKIGNDTVVFIYEPMACHSYNEIKIQGRDVKIATIDTILSFYLAFLYASRDYYDTDRIICMAQYLFKVQQENRLKQKGLLRRFSISCYGHQQTIEEIRAAKAAKFLELKDKKGTLEYEEYFLRYRPGDKLKSSTTTSTSTSTSTPNNNRMRIKNNRKSTMRNITNKQYKQDKSKTRQSRQTKNNANNKKKSKGSKKWSWLQP